MQVTRLGRLGVDEGLVGGGKSPLKLDSYVGWIVVMQWDAWDVDLNSPRFVKGRKMGASVWVVRVGPYPIDRCQSGCLGHFHHVFFYVHASSRLKRSVSSFHGLGLNWHQR